MELPLYLRSRETIMGNVLFMSTATLTAFALSMSGCAVEYVVLNASDESSHVNPYESNTKAYRRGYDIASAYTTGEEL